MTQEGAANNELLLPLLEKNEEDGARDEGGIHMALRMEVEASPQVEKAQLEEVEIEHIVQDEEEVHASLAPSKSGGKEGKNLRGATSDAQDEEHPQPFFVWLYYAIERYSVLEMLCSWFAPHTEGQTHEQTVKDDAEASRSFEDLESQQGENMLESNTQGKEGLMSIVDVGALRCLWVLFQVVWPFVLITCDCVTALALVVPSVFTFWLASRVVKGNILNKFGKWDFLPTAFWVLAFMLNEDSFSEALTIVVLFAFVLTSLLLAIVGPRKVWEFCLRNNTIGALAIKISGKIDSLSREMAKFLGEDGGDEEKEESQDTEKVNADLPELDRLEELSQRGMLKKPHWVMAAVAILVIWQLGFLIYTHSITLAPYQDAYTTKEKYPWLDQHVY